MNRVELAAVRDLLTAIHDALEDLPVPDEGNAIQRWAAAYCNTENAAAWVGLAAEGKLLAADSPAERLSDYAGRIRESLLAGDGRVTRAREAGCGRCGSPVAKPGERSADGALADRARWCDLCIDRCHEATDFAHVCHLCATPEEAAARGWDAR